MCFDIIPKLSKGEETASNTFSIASPVPGDLDLTTDGTVSFGDDIVLTCSTDDTDYKVWFDTSVTVEVFEEASLTTNVYSWPSDLVTDDSDEESGADEDVEITLKSVPQELFDLETVHVKLTVRFRNVAGDRRLMDHTETTSTGTATSTHLRGGSSDIEYSIEDEFVSEPTSIEIATVVHFAR